MKIRLFKAGERHARGIRDGNRKLDQIDLQLLVDLRSVEEEEIGSLVVGDVDDRCTQEARCRQPVVRNVDRVWRPIPGEEFFLIGKKRDALDRIALRILNAELHVRNVIGSLRSRDLHFEWRLALVDDERIRIDVAATLVVPDRTNLDSFRELTEVELSAVGRSVAGHDFLAFDPELDAFDRRLHIDIDDEQIGRHIAARRNDLHRIATLGHAPLRDHSFRTVGCAGNVLLIRSCDREMRAALRDNDRGLLLERNHEPRLDVRVARLQRLNRSQ